MPAAARQTTVPQSGRSAVMTPPHDIVFLRAHKQINPTAPLLKVVDGWLRRCAELLRPGQQVAVMLADVYEYGDKDSAAMLRMSVPSFKLLLHRSRARLNAFGAAASSRVRVRMRHDGVVSHLDRGELRRLREQLANGIRFMTMWVWYIADLIDLELLDLLFDL